MIGNAQKKENYHLIQQQLKIMKINVMKKDIEFELNQVRWLLDTIFPSAIKSTSLVKSVDAPKDLSSKGERVHSEETKKKISEKMKGKQNSNQIGKIITEECKEKIRKKLQIIRYTKCKMCNIEFRYHKRKKMTCGDKCLSDLKKLNNRKKKEIILDSDDE